MLLGFWMTNVHGASAEELLLQDLSTKAPSCHTTPVKRPKLQAERGPESKDAIASGWYSPLIADFNGDGWCDFAWEIPYPVNSKMASYYLDDLLVLGGKRVWRSPFRGHRPSMFDLDREEWPRFRVDLTEIAMVYEKSGGAPYVLGLWSGYDLGKEWVGLGCWEYSSVYRWDKAVDAFKKVDDATRDTVIAFYYSTIGTRCARPKK